MRRYSSRQNLQTLTELNVTPLIDLAFVLLIIFMITTPLIENTIDLVVPKSSTAAGEVDPIKTVIISIDEKQTIQLDGETMDATTLEQRLQAIHLEKPQTPVVVRPHKDLPIQQFISVMDILQRVGLSKVGVMTRREEPTAP
jgi:biopolymer transport protein ExbD